MKKLENKVCYLQHLSEGVVETARKQFMKLKRDDGTWALHSSFSGIHSTALQPDDFKILKDHGASVVWSPLSNFLLYGKTTDVRAAKESGNIDLIVADNQLSSEVALTVADRLIAKEVDLAIEYQIDEKSGSLIMNKFQQAGIPVIAIDIPIVGATFVGANNYRSGYMAGEALGQWINNHWHGQLDRLFILEEPRAGALPASRIQGQLDGLKQIVGDIPAEKINYLDSGNRSDISQKQMAKTLRANPEASKLAVISFNDDAALGALLAARQAKREEDVVIVGQGADRMLRPEIRRPNSRVIGSTALMPEKYGEKLIDLALKILRGKPVPPAIYTDHIFINAENIDLFYPE